MQEFGVFDYFKEIEVPEFLEKLEFVLLKKFEVYKFLYRCLLLLNYHENRVSDF